MLALHNRPGRRPPASTAARRNARTAAPSPRTGCRRTRCSYSPITIAPQPRSGSASCATSAAACGRRAHATVRIPRRRTAPPRSPRGRVPASRPAPAAASATSPDPASPRSTPARKTRTAGTWGRVSPPCGCQGLPPTTPARQLPCPHQTRWPASPAGTFGSGRAAPGLIMLPGYHLLTPANISVATGCRSPGRAESVTPANSSAERTSAMTVIASRPRPASQTRHRVPLPAVM